MKKEFCLARGLQHYVCLLVDLLSRAGLLRKALTFIDDNYVKPDSVIWGTKGTLTWVAGARRGQFQEFVEVRARV
ncbi:hypothetical protein Syun_004206 [Stephania yunnanensis]|uniref:Uncharacterized protein n=1 Tax=Stephania yunnanensis TaxID=152371 RepID=A0AAP0L6R4_9MAGN